VLEGLYSAAAGMAAQQQRIDAVSNDIANVSTTGYKRTRLSFHDLAYAAQSTGNDVRAGAGSAAAWSSRSEVAGSIEQTGQPFDLAIVGDGYLQVRRPDGQIGLTRQGSLRLNADRQLVTVNGDRLQPPIEIPADVAEQDVTIGADGTVTAPGGRNLGQITLRDVPAPGGLQDAGGSLSIPTQASGAVRNATGGTLQQGSLERSNVDMADAMTSLVEAQRSYTMASRALQTQDQLMEIANGIKR
jgi:flagellar basal-body rod protein FlgG